MKNERLLLHDYYSEKNIKEKKLTFFVVILCKSFNGSMLCVLYNVFVVEHKVCV